MADSQRNTTHGSRTSKQRPPSRLQMRAPSSLQVNRACDWNVAIPLLSPLRSSPPPAAQMPASAMEDAQQIDQIRQPPPPQRHQGAAEAEKVVFKKWQHPAAPFCYEPGSLVPSPFFRCV